MQHDNPTARFILAGLLWAFALPTLGVMALDTPSMWKARFSTFKGDLSCTYGDPDCNRCANNVRQAFREFDSQSGQDFDYTYNLAERYAPAAIAPREFLSLGPGHSAHLQTFTRLPLESSSGDSAWFAATYGGGYVGIAATYLVTAPTSREGGPVNGDGQIAYVYEADGLHPGGSQGIGHYLVVGHDEQEAPKGYLVVYDLSDPSTGSWARKSIKGDVRSSGVGAAKLAGGGLLLLSKQGGPNNDYQLYYANSVENGLRGFEYVAKVTGDSSVENVSLVTECGTGDIYAIAGTGNNGVYTQNRFSLFRMAMKPAGAQLTPIDTASNTQETDCDARAAGTAFVAQDGNLAFYCAQKLGTEVRPEWLDCVLPVETRACEDGAWACIRDWAQEFLSPISDCAEMFNLDSEMTLRQYW